MRAGIGSGAKIILNTVAVNLKDCPPFASWHDTNLPAADSDRFDKLYAAALGSEGAQTNFAEAAQQYEQAAKLDPHVADLEFRWADCLARLTNYSAARKHFERARDLDALPFRASSKINLLTEQVARRFGGADLIFFDAAGLFATNSPTGVPGQEWFYEHAHFNFGGNYRLARAWAEQAERFLPQSARGRSAADWASQAICERHLGLTDWNRIGVIEDLIRRLLQPPLSSQPNNARRLEALHAWLGQLRAHMDKSDAAEARHLYTGTLKDSPDDHRLHENFAEFLEAVGDLPQATVEWLRVRQLIPQHHLAYFQAGRLLLRQDKLAEARALLLQAVALRPDLGEGWLELGKIHAIEGKPELALQDYEHERRLVPQDYRTYYHIGKALINLNRHAEAMENFQQALRLNPNYWEARYAWGEELAFAGKVADARKAFEEVLQLKPDYAMAHLNLGVALVQQGQLGAAEHQFEETIRLDPQNKLATNYLAQLRARKTHREQ